MSLSRVLIVLWVFLVSTVGYLAWFSVDAKLIGFVGVAFVVVAVLEAFHPIVIPFRKRTVVEE